MADEPTVETLLAENTSLKARLKEVNDESKGHRLNSDNFRKGNESLLAENKAANEMLEAERRKHAEDLEKLRIDLTGQATAAEAKAAEAATKAKNKVMLADLRIAARDAGMLDLDGLKLLDMAQCKTDDEGNVTNAAELLSGMKEAKPYFFGEVPKPGTVTGTTTTTTPPPSPKPPNGAFNARTASREEYAAAKQEMLGAVRR